MTEFQDVHLEQYLLPAYWDGHTLGMGETGQANETPNMQLGRTRNTLHDFFRSGAALGANALATFRTDSTFDPSQYESGTVLRIRHEMIEGWHRATVDVDSLEGIPLPPPEALVDPRKKTLRERGMMLIDDMDKTMISYTSEIEWGVIAKGIDGKGIAKLGEMDLAIWRSLRRRWMPQNPKPPRIPLSAVFLGPITVGEVVHTKRERFPWTEKVERVNRIDVCAYGKSERAAETDAGTSSRMRSWLSRLGLAGA